MRITTKITALALSAILTGTSVPYFTTKNQTMTVCAASKQFTAVQQERINTIVRVCIENYDTYGVLPSVCLAQAMIESTMGEHCSGYNLWGIRAGASKYSSLEEGTLAYLKVINNGYYKGAPFCKDPAQTLRYILDGNYCVPEGNYYANAIKIINDYNLTQYDSQMFETFEQQKREQEEAAREKAEAIRKKKEKIRKEREAIRKKKAEEKARREELARQKRVAEWTKREEENKVKAVYDPFISDKIIVANEKVVSAGAICLYHNNALYGVYTVVNNTDKDVIRINDVNLAGKKVMLSECIIPSVIPVGDDEVNADMPSIDIIDIPDISDAMHQYINPAFLASYPRG